jgi:hypothetical protein
MRSRSSSGSRAQEFTRLNEAGGGHLSDYFDRM